MGDKLKKAAKKALDTAENVVVGKSERDIQSVEEATKKAAEGGSK